MAQSKDVRGTASNIKIDNIYSNRKYKANIIGMSQHILKMKWMAAINRKAEQTINKKNSTMQGDQRHGFKYQN